MVDFLLCILQYVLEMIILAAVGCAGAFFGIKLRKKKDAKKALENAGEGDHS